MEEINLEEETGKKKKKVGLAIVLVSVSIVAFLLSFFLFDSIFSSDESGSFVNSSISQTKLEISGTSLKVEYSEYLGYSATITGIARNTTKRNYSYASVEFSVYDAAGNNLGTALANINNLFSGDTWRFEATLLAFTDTRPSSYKLVEITAW